MQTKLTRGQAIAADVSALLRARNPLIWIVTREEARVERLMFEAAGAADYMPYTWDVAQGVADVAGKAQAALADPGEALNAIRAKATEAGTPERRVWIMRDLPAWLSGPGSAPTVRALRNLARLLPTTVRERAQAVIVLSPSGDIPPELAGHATVIEMPMPDREEIAAVLDSLVEQYDLGEKMQNGRREAAIDAAVGLTQIEAQACYSKSLVMTRDIDPVAVTKEKKTVIARERVLEWFDPIPGGLDAVGGLENLKAWLVARASAYTPAAREYGLPVPKGGLLAGIPGCGKSLTAKAIATAWGVPLLKVDLGAIKSKFVGESESNLRRAFRVIETVGRCVVWFDEIEKALQGATSGSADGGVSSDALGAVLNWMQERKSDAFVMATANDVESLPPELLRKGRFDEVWWVDLPTRTERAAILDATLRQFKRSDGSVNLDRIADVTEGFTGSEIAALVPDAMYVAFADGARQIRTDDLIAAAKTVVPLSKTAAEKITRLRNWATGRARPASAPDVADQVRPKVRALDL
jgi:ATPase family associated with various cellular activities (AAA)/AAA+ lid domain